MQHRLVFSNKTLTDADLYGNIKYIKDLNTEDNLYPGTVSSAEVTFETNKLDSSAIGKTFTYYIDNALRGDFTITEAVKNKTRYKITAYDNAIKLDKDITPLFDTLTWPLTLKSLFESICVYCGVTYSDTSAISTFQVNKFSLPKMNAREVLSLIGQLMGCAIEANVLGRISPRPIGVAAPYTVDNSEYVSYEYADYTCPAIDCVWAGVEDGDAGYQYPASGGNNCLKIYANPVFAAIAENEKSTLIENLYNNYHNVTYTPCKIKLLECTIPLWSYFYIKVDNKISLITKITIDNSGYELVSVGEPTRPETASSQEVTQILNGKYSIINNTVDGLVVTVGEHSTELGDIESTITAQAAQITAKVDKQSNPQATFGWNLQTDGMTIFNQEGNVVEIDEDGLSVKGNIQAKTGSIGTGLFKVFASGTEPISHIDLTAVDANYDFNLVGLATQLVGKDSGTVIYSGVNSNYQAQFTVNASTIESVSTITLEILYQGQPYDEYNRMKSSCGTFNVTQTERTGFIIESGKLYNGKSTFTDNNNGVYIGTDGIALGQSAFSVDNQGNLKANDGDIGPLQINRWNGLPASESITFESEQGAAYSYNLYFDTPKSAVDSEKQAVIRINHGTDPENPYYVDLSKVLMAFRNFSRSQGTYVLKMTVDNNGKVLYSWVKEN